MTTLTIAALSIALLVPRQHFNCSTVLIALLVALSSSTWHLRLCPANASITVLLALLVALFSSTWQFCLYPANTLELCSLDSTAAEESSRHR